MFWFILIENRSKHNSWNALQVEINFMVVNMIPLENMLPLVEIPHPLFENRRLWQQESFS